MKKSMKQKMTAMLMGSFMALALGTAFAHPSADSQEYREPQKNHRQKPPSEPYVIKDRIARQERAILAGQRNGSLNGQEAGILRHNIAKIKTAYLRAKQSDQYISWHERKRLDEMLDRNQRMIHRMKDNPISSL